MDLDPGVDVESLEQIALTAKADGVGNAEQRNPRALGKGNPRRQRVEARANPSRLASCERQRLGLRGARGHHQLDAAPHIDA